jgi:hypothetical protein
MRKASDLHARWRRDPEYRKAFDALGPEFERVGLEIEAQTRPGEPQHGGVH